MTANGRLDGHPTHAVAVIGGAVAGSEAASLLAQAGILTVVIEQNDRPYGKIEDGLPRWHDRQRRKEYARIDAKLEHPLIHFIPRTRLGRDVTLRELQRAWGVDAILLATGAWRDRPLALAGAEPLVGKGLLYQNPLIHWFNHEAEPGYQGPRYEVPDGTVVVGGGLASIDVIKIVQLTIVRRALRERGIDESVLDMERRGVPDTLAAHRLAWPDLGLRGGTLIYRRRKQDMPISKPADESDAALTQAQRVRAKVLDRAAARYGFTFLPCRQPVGLVARDGRVSGLEVARTEVPEGRGASPRRIPGSEEILSTSLVIGSIGSVPEHIGGIPVRGELYRYRDLETGEIEGLPGVYGVGNVVTGQGNIHVSRSHARGVASDVLDRYLEGTGALDEDDLLQGVEGRVARQAEAIVRRVLSSKRSVDLRRVLSRVAAHQRVAGYEGYRAWMAAHATG